MEARKRLELKALGKALFRAFLIFLLLGLYSSPKAQISSLETENLARVNSDQHDYWPQISPDGRFLIFQSDRPGYKGSYNIWISVNLDHQNPREKQVRWTRPVPLVLPIKALLENMLKESTEQIEDGSILKKGLSVDGESSGASFSNESFFSVNSNDFEGSPSLLYDKGELREIFFTFAKAQTPLEKEAKDLDIYLAKLERGRWNKAQALTAINSEFEDRMPSLSRDGRYLVFSSNRPGGLGKHDLWFSERNLKTGRWSRPQNAGPILNTTYNETAPNFTYGGKRLFFSSDRPGGLGHYDIYTSLYHDGRWQNPKNLGSPYNSPRDDEGFSISQDRLWAYFSSDRRLASYPYKEGFDIYRAPLAFWLYGSREITFTGQVIDASSKEILGLEAAVKVFTPYTQEKARVSTSFAFRKAQNAKGINNFKLTLRSGFRYRVEVSAPGFIPQELFLDYRRDRLPSQVDRHVIRLQRLGTGADGSEISAQKEACTEAKLSCLAQTKIYFASNLFEISPEEAKKLERVIKIMRKNPALKIRIEGHTDRTNTQDYNQKLSERRAQAVRQALLQAGIKAGRLKVSGYSFSKPAVPERSMKDRILNRRVEFAPLK